MYKYIYPLIKWKIKPWLKYYIVKKGEGTPSEIITSASPITLVHSLRRKFRIFQIGGNSVQDGEPSPTNEVPIQNVTGDVEVKVENKNIFDTGNFTVSGNQNLDIKRDEEGSFIINGTNTSNTYINLYNIIPLNGDYTLFLYSNKTNSSAIYCNLYNSAESFATVNRIAYQGISNQQSRYLNFSSVEKCLSQRINIEAGTYSNFILKIMLVEGTYNLTNIGDYVPHEEQTAIFPLEEGQILHEGDTIEDKIVQRRKTTKLWSVDKLSTVTLFEVTFKFATYSLPDAIKEGRNYSFLCDRVAPAREQYGKYKGYLNKGAFIVMTDADDTLKNFNKKIAGATLEYELETPIETEFTEAQRTAKAQIDKLYSYKGTTYISSTNEPSPIFEVQYYMEGE